MWKCVSIDTKVKSKVPKHGCIVISVLYEWMQLWATVVIRTLGLGYVSKNISTISISRTTMLKGLILTIWNQRRP